MTHNIQKLIEKLDLQKYPEGGYFKQVMGLNFDRGELPQFTVPKETWFAAEVNEPDFRTNTLPVSVVMSEYQNKEKNNYESSSDK
jgi:predicted cupin superfamily sugar epimerase